MKIQSVQIDGFGCLVDVAYPLAPGLNIFFGPNEIGKSTLQQAILALLYGFYSKTRRNAQEADVLERFRPWRGTVFGGQLEYELNQRGAYCVIRDFNGDLKTHLLDGLTKRELSSEFEPGRLGRLDFAQKQFGLSYDVFVNTCFVRQADLHHLDQVAQKISETVMNLADTGSRDHSILNARALLEKALENQVGRERATTKPLAQAKTRLQAVQTEHARVTQLRKEREADYAARQTHETQLQELDAALARVNYLLARHKFNALDARLVQVRALNARQTETRNEFDALAYLADFPSDARDDVLRLTQARETQHARVSNLGALAEQARIEMDALELQAASLRDQVRELEPARAIPFERQNEAQTLERRLNDTLRASDFARGQLDETTRKIAAQKELLPAAEPDAEHLRAELEWLGKQRVAWQTARVRLVEAEERENAARATWRARALTIPELAHADNPTDAESELARWKHALDRANFLLARQERDSLQKQIDVIEQSLTRANELTHQLDAMSFVVDFPLVTRDELLRLEPAWRAQLSNFARQQELAFSAREEMTALEAQVTSLHAQADALQAARFVPVERADEIRALEQIWRDCQVAYIAAQTQLTEINNALAAKQELKAVLERHRNLLAAPPEKFPTLRAQWNAARERVTHAQTRFDAADAAWRAMGVDAAEWEHLQEQLAGVDETVLAELKTPSAPSLENVTTRRRATSVLFVLAALLGVGGLILFALGNTLFGVGLLAAALFVLGGAFLWRARRKSPSPQQMDARITTRGFSNLSEMETAFASLQTARPLREELRASERALETARAELMPLENELVALLQLADAGTLSDEMLEVRELQLQQWRAEISELVALGKTRGEREQTLHDRALVRDAAAAQWRTALADCGFGGDDDLERATRAFLTRCDERRNLDFLDAQLNFFNAQIEMKRASIKQAQDAQMELAHQERELRAILTRAQIADDDLERALAEYHRRAELATQAQALEQKRLALERERGALTQTESLAQMQTRRATFANEMTQLLTAHPEFETLAATTTITQLGATRAALLDARPFLEQWRDSADARTNVHAQFVALCAELASRLQLADTDTLTDERIAAAEEQRRQWLAARRELDALQRELEPRRTAHEIALAHARQVEESLRALLRAAGFEAIALAQDTRTFLEQCEKRKTLERVESELRAVNTQIESKRAQMQEARDARNKLDATESELRELLARVGIATNDLAQAAAEFHQRVELATKRRTLGETLAALERELRARLAEQTLEQLETQHAAVGRECADYIKTNPAFESLTDSMSPAQLEHERAKLEGERVTLHRALSAIETRLSTVENTRGLAEIEEEMLDLHERIGALTAHGLALNLALEYLDQAADEHHRDFLPRLNQIVSESLKIVTGGRYQKVSIDHQDFQVRLEIPERATPVTPDQLSRGAQEQIYLLLRLGLTELMSRGRERLPLILDDPLVNYDRARLHHALDFLSDLAAHSQILLFTKDDAIVEWFEENKFDSTIHKLHRMESSTPRAIQSTALSVEPEPPQVTTQFAPNETAAARGIEVRDDLPTKEGKDKSNTQVSGAESLIPDTTAKQQKATGRVVPAQKHFILPEARGGGNREKRWQVEGNVTRTTNPELVCWQRSGFWQIGVELNLKLARNPRLTLVQGGQILTADSRDETRWVLPSLRENILIQESEDDASFVVTLNESSHFIFKLQGKRVQEGRRVRAFSSGAYMVVVPASWRVYESSINSSIRQPEEIAIEGWVAHFFEIERGELAHIAFWDGHETLVTLEGRAARYQLTGERIHDGDTERGPLFGSTAPRIQLAREFKWPLIQTIVVGEEGGGENKWRDVISVRDDQTEQSLDVIATRGTGWYFVRLYDEQLELVESLDFRFCRGLKKIVMPENSPLPDGQGHSVATVEIHHDTETFVMPTDALTRALALQRDGEITRIVIPNEPRFDTTRWNIGKNSEEVLEIVTRVERVWWTFGEELVEPSEWQAHCAALALQDFSAVSERAFWLRLPAPRWAERVRILFGGEFRSFNVRAGKAIAFCALREFETVAHRLPFGVHPFRIEIQQKENSHATNVGELRIAARCKKCDYQTLSEHELFEHVRAKHLDEYFQPLTYDELRALDPHLPQAIYKCPYDRKYAKHNPPLENGTAAIFNHISRDHPGKPHAFRVVSDLAEIRQFVIEDLLDAVKCKLCREHLKYPNAESKWTHLHTKHAKQLYQRV